MTFYGPPRPESNIPLTKLEPQTWQDNGFPPTKLDDPNAMPMDLKPPTPGEGPLSGMAQAMADRIDSYKGWRS